MNVLYFDCTAGASGDMLLGALLDVFVNSSVSKKPQEAQTTLLGCSELRPWLLQIEGLLACEPRASIELRQVIRHETEALKVEFIVDGESADIHQGSMRRFRDIRKLLEEQKSAHLSTAAFDLSIRSFEILAEAEARAHGCAPDDVHFHEVGAFDSIMDIAGFCAALTLLSPDRIYSSPVTTGSGEVKTAHGWLSVPPPAVKNILDSHPIAVSSRKLDGECLTPTGAALLAAIVDVWDEKPIFSANIFTGAGAGTRQQGETANVVKCFFGKIDES